jgi:hypothetical protein
MVYLKNPDLGKFWGALVWKRLVYLMANWIFKGNFAFKWTFGNILVVVLIYFPLFGILCQEKSGKPGCFWLVSWVGQLTKSMPSNVFRYSW